jgi:hypothetical protein
MLQRGTAQDYNSRTYIVSLQQKLPMMTTLGPKIVVFVDTWIVLVQRLNGIKMKYTLVG